MIPDSEIWKNTSLYCGDCINIYDGQGEHRCLAYDRCIEHDATYEHILRCGECIMAESLGDSQQCSKFK